MRTALIVTVVIGGVCFLWGYVWNAATARRRRLDITEASGLGRRGRWFAKGQAIGVAWSDEITFAEMKRGVGDGTWRTSARLQQFMLVTGGGLTAILGLALLIGWSLGPGGFAGALVLAGYAVVRTVQGFRRA